MQDIAAPKLLSISLNSSSLNIDTGRTTLQVTAHLSDNLSGIGSTGAVQIRFVSPSGQISDGVFDTEHPISGGPLDGVYKASLTLPANAEAGLWQVEYLSLNDKAGNMTFLSPTNSTTLARTSFTVENSASDVRAPVLHSINLNTTSLDVESGHATLQVTAHLSDNLSGIGSTGAVQIRFVSSSGQIADGVFDTEHPISGGTLNGVYKASVTLPASAEEGRWHVEYLSLNDKAGNMTFLSPTNSTTLARTSFTVANSASDVKAPVLHSINLNTTSLDVESGHATLQVTAHLSDNLSGIGSTGAVQIRFVSSSGQIADGVFDTEHPISGGTLNGVYKASVTLPAGAEEGRWHVEYLSLNDKAGNMTFLSPTNSTTLAGTSFMVGTAGNDILLGTSAAEGFFGGAGDDSLNGGAGFDVLNGGSGKDTLNGGLGNDIYVLENGADAVSDSGGIDTATSTTSRSLAGGGLSTVENLTLVNVAPALNGIGNGLNNVITGNNFSNTLSGGLGNDTLKGGLGNDTLNGGLGNDVYVLESGADTLSDAGGIDTATSTVSRSLASGGLTAVENLTLLGSANLSVTGNAFGNVLTGNAGSNLLTGNAGNDRLNGGTGADNMRGGAGNDVYVVDNASDIVNESMAGSSGTDTVQSAISFNLTNTTRVFGALESLTLLGTGNINGTGNSLNNVVNGNSGANTLNGAAGNDTINGGSGNDNLYGGAGNDRLMGGAGYDSFVFKTALNPSTNVDAIVDFNVIQDTIRLDNAVMSALDGAFESGEFWKSTSGLAHDSNDRIIYETDTGWLNYDSNGSAAGGAVHIARLAPNLALTAGDFFVV